MKKLLCCCALLSIMVMLFPSVSFSADFIQDSIQQLLNTGQFQKLDAMAAKFRKSREILPNGHWALTDFYLFVSTPQVQNEYEYLQLIKICEKWKEAYPDSPSPYIALSHLYRGYAFDARGGGWASEVREEGWRLFKERVNKAYGYVNNKVASRDIHSYSERIYNLVAIGGRDTKEKAYKVFEEGNKREPDYYPLYFAMSKVYMERWGGERGDMIRFLDKYSEKRGGIKGKLIYVNTLLYMSKYYEFSNYLPRIGVSWERLEYFIKTILNEQPDNLAMLNAYWYFASLSFDLDKAAKLREELDKKDGWMNDMFPFDRKGIDYLKKLSLVREHVAKFDIDISSVWRPGNQLEISYDLLGKDGKKTKSLGGYSYKNSSGLYYNISLKDYISYIIVPDIYQNKQIVVRCTFKNVTTGKQVVSEETLGSSRKFAANKDMDCPSGNLIKNNSADNGANNWSVEGSAGGRKFPSGKTAFYANYEIGQSKGNRFGVRGDLFQDIAIPEKCEGGFAVAAGRVTFQIPNLPHFPLYPNVDIDRYNENATRLKHHPLDESSELCGENCWATEWKLVPLDQKVSYIRVYLGYTFKPNGPPPTKGTTYYDDLELRIFPTEKQARAFIAEYEKKYQARDERKDAGLRPKDCIKGNFLKNPHAIHGADGWELIGQSGFLPIGDKDTVFYAQQASNTESILSQNISYPIGCGAGFLVFAGYISEEKNHDTLAESQPGLNVVVENTEGRKTSFQSPTMKYDCKAPCWQSRWGMHPVGPAISSIRFEMEQPMTGKGGKASYFDDAELRFFSTREEAEKFIQEYKKKHPDG